jgi:hypothetical protein
VGCSRMVLSFFNCSRDLWLLFVARGCNFSDLDFNYPYFGSFPVFGGCVYGCKAADLVVQVIVLVVTASGHSW